MEAGIAPADTHSQAGTEGESMAETEAALSWAQQAQREAMLVGHTSLNDSRKRLMEVREAMQGYGQEQQYAEDQEYGQNQHDGQQQHLQQYEQAPIESEEAQLQHEPPPISSQQLQVEEAAPAQDESQLNSPPKHEPADASGRTVTEPASAGSQATEQLSENEGEAQADARSTAGEETAVEAGSSGHYAPVPPSSLWGRAAAAVDSLAAAFTGHAEADTADTTGAERAGEPEIDATGDREADRAAESDLRTARSLEANTAAGMAADRPGNAEADKVGSAEAEFTSPRAGQEGWSRPATHANFARGIYAAPFSLLSASASVSVHKTARLCNWAARVAGLSVSLLC